MELRPAPTKEIKMARYKSRNAHAATTMELAASLPIIIIVTIFSINTAACMFAADFCDRACKDCARAAGQMSTPDDAVNAMNAAAAAHPVDNLFFQQLTPQLLVYQDYNSSLTTPTPIYGSTPAYNGENGSDDLKPTKHIDSTTDNTTLKVNDTATTNINAIITDPNQTITPGPYVIVRTTMLMRIPISINFLGLKLFPGNVENNPQLLQFQSIYTFPITNTYVPM